MSGVAETRTVNEALQTEKSTNKKQSLAYTVMRVSVNFLSILSVTE